MEKIEINPAMQAMEEARDFFRFIFPPDTGCRTSR
jgi:hypothetical protein